MRTTQQGQVYFFHIPTGVSTWHDPRIPRDLAPLGLVLDQLGPLPPGWEMRQTASGRVSTYSYCFYTVSVSAIITDESLYCFKNYFNKKINITHAVKMFSSKKCTALN